MPTPPLKNPENVAINGGGKVLPDPADPDFVVKHRGLDWDPFVAAEAQRPKAFDQCCKTRLRRCLTCYISCCCSFFLIVLALVICGFLLWPIAKSTFSLVGGKVSLGCDAGWPLELHFELYNPSLMSVHLSGIWVGLKRHSTSVRFASVDMREPIHISSGTSTHRVTGSLMVLNASEFAAAIGGVVPDMNFSALDVSAAIDVRISTSAFLGIPLSLQQSITIPAETIRGGTSSDSGSSTPRKKSTTAATTTTTTVGSTTTARETVKLGCTPASFTIGELEVHLRSSTESLVTSAQARVSPGICPPDGVSVEVGLPPLHFTAIAVGVGDAVAISTSALSLALHHPTLSVGATVALESRHAEGAEALARAAMGEGPDATMRLVAARSSNCSLQEVLGHLPYLLERKLSRMGGGDAGLGAAARRLAESAGLSAGPLSLASLSGELGRTGVEQGAELRLAANLSELMPGTRVSVTGNLPALSIAVDLESQAEGCSPRRAALAEIAPSVAPLNATELLELPVRATSARQWSEALAVGAAGMLSSGSRLTAVVHLSNSTSILGRILSWWELRVVLSKGASSARRLAGSDLAVDVSVVSAAEDARVDLLLGGLAANGSVLADASARGSLAMSSTGTRMAQATLAAGPLSSGLGVGLQLGGSRSARGEVLLALQNVLKPLMEGDRPGSPVLAHGSLGVSTLDLDLAVNGSLEAWPAEALATLAELNFSGSAHLKELAMSPSMSLLVKEGPEAEIAMQIPFVGSFEGTSFDFTLHMPGVVLKASDLESCASSSARATGDSNRSSTAASSHSQPSGSHGGSGNATSQGGGRIAGLVSAVEIRTRTRGGRGHLRLRDNHRVPLDIGAVLEGSVGPLAMSALKVSVHTTMGVELGMDGTSSQPQSTILNVSLLDGRCGLDAGNLTMPILVTMVDKAALMDFAGGFHDFALRFVPGPDDDFLGALMQELDLAAFTYHSELIANSTASRSLQDATTTTTTTEMPSVASSDGGGPASAGGAGADDSSLGGFLKGGRLLIDCGSLWRHEIHLTLGSPIPLRIETGIMEVERASTGQRVANLQLLPPGGLVLGEGENDVRVSGSTEVLDPDGLGSAMSKVVSSGKLSDVDLLTSMRLRVTGTEPDEASIHVDVVIVFAPEDLEEDDRAEVPRPGRILASTSSGSSGASCARASPGLESAHAHFARGAEGAVELAVFASARTGLCLDAYEFLEVQLPSLRLAVSTLGVGEAAELVLGTLNLDLRRPAASVAAFLALRRQHVAGAAAALRAAMGEGPGATVQLVALNASDCALQQVLAAIPKLAEFEVAAIGGGGETVDADRGAGQRASAGSTSASANPSFGLKAFVGELGGPKSLAAHLRVAANLSAMLPSLPLTVSGVLPAITLQAELEGQAAGCGARSAVLGELATTTVPLGSTGGLLEVHLAAGTSSKWSEAMVVGISGMMATGSDLTLRVRPNNDSSVMSQVLSWWELEQKVVSGEGSTSPSASAASAVNATTTTTEAPATTTTPSAPRGDAAESSAADAGGDDGFGVNLSVASTRDSLNLDLHLSDLVATTSMLANATLSGNILLKAVGKLLGFGTLAAAPLSSGLAAGVQLGGFVREQALEALRAIVEPLLSGDSPGGRPGRSVSVVGGVDLAVPVDSFKEAVVASVGMDMELFRDAASLANALLSLSARLEELSLTSMAALNVSEGMAVVASGSLAVVGSIPGAFGSLVEGADVNITIAVPALAMQPADLGLEPCSGDRLTDPAGGTRRLAPLSYALRVAVLGGAGPGEELEVPCIFSNFCPFGAHDPRHVSLDVGANVSGSMPLLSLQKMRVGIDTSLLVEVSVNDTSHGLSEMVAVGSLLRSISMDRGELHAPVRLTVHNESMAAAFLESSVAWSVRCVEGPDGDFLGSLLGSFSKPLLEGGGGQAPQPRRLASLLDSLQLASTDSKSMGLRVTYPLPRMSSMDVELVLGDALNVSVDFEGHLVAGLHWAPARVSAQGGPMGADLLVFQHSVSARAKLERLVELLAEMGAMANPPPLMQIGGRISSGVGGGFNLRMRALVPQMLAKEGPAGSTSGGCSDGSSGRRLSALAVFKGASFAITSVSLNWWWLSIALWIQVTLRLNNPLPFNFTIESLDGTMYLDDSDGARYFYATRLYATPNYRVSGISTTDTVLAVSGEDFLLKVPMRISSYAGWRFYEESQKATFHISVPDVAIGVSIRHSDSEKPFRMTIRTGLHCIALPGTGSS